MRPSDHLVDGKYSIKDLVDLKKLRTIFQSFTNSMGFTIGFLSVPDLEILIATGWRDICTHYHRIRPLAAARCRRSNLRMVRRLKKSGQVVIAACENGLVDCATPIVIKGKLVAILATGQVLLKSPDISRFKKQAKLFGIREKKYLAEIKKVPVVSQKQLRAVTQFLNKLARLVAEMGYASLVSKEKAEVLKREVERRKKTERLLKEAAGQLGTLYGAVTDGVLVAEIKTKKILVANASACRLFDYSEKEFLGKTISDLHPRNDLKVITAHFEHLVANRISFVSHIPCLKKNGEVFFSDIAAKTVLYDGKKCLVGFFRDMTTKRRTETSLRLASFSVNHASDPVFWIGPDSRLIYANDAGCRSLGYLREDLLKKRVCDVDPDFPAERWPSFWKEIKRKRVMLFESRHRMKTGRVFPVEITANFVSFEGREYLFAFVRNIAERRRAEEAVQRSEERYRALVETTDTGYVILDRWGRVIDANAEYVRLTGFRSLRQIRGRSVLEWTAEDEKKKNAIAVRECIKGGSIRNFEVDYVGPKGGITPVEINATVIGKGDSRLILTLCRDITGRRRAEQDLKRTLSLERATLESTADGILVVDGHTRNVADFNARFVQLWKIPSRLLQSRSDKRLLGFVLRQLENPRQFLSKVEELYCYPRRSSFDVLKFKDGRIFERYSQPQIVEEKAVGRVWSFRDVTARERSELALRESEKRYRSLFENMANGFAYCKMLYKHGQPQDFIYLAVNKAFESQTGLANVVGKKVSRIIPGIRKADPELFEIYGRVARTGIPERFEHYVKVLRAWFSVSVYSLEKDHFVALFDVITKRKQAEELLRENEERLRLLYSNMSEGLALHEMVYDLKGRPVDYRIIDVNNAYTRHTGFKASDVRGKLGSVVYAGKRAPFLEIYSEVATNGGAKSFEAFFPPMKRYFGISVFSPQRGKFATVFTDITARRQAEEKLRLSERQLRSYIDNAGDAIYVIDLWGGRFVNCNKQACRDLGYSKRELLELSPKDVEISLNPDAIDQVHRHIAAKKTGLVEGVHKRKDGSTFPVEIRFTLFEIGQEKYLLSIVRDVTARKQAEELLRQREAYLRSIVDNQSGLVWLKDREGRFLAVNQIFARMAGQKNPEQVVGKTDFDFWPRELANKYRQDDLNVVKARKPFVTEELIFEKGVARWHETFKTPILDAKGNVIGTTGYARDITERKKAEEALMLSKQKMELHIKRTPLAVIEWDKNFKVAEWNPAAEKIFGYRKNEALGRNWDFIVPKPARAVVREIGRALLKQKGGQRSTNENITKTGKTIVCEWFNTTLVGSDGKTIGVASLVEDITERVAAEDAIRKSQAQYRQLVENAKDGIFTIDFSGKFLLTNPEFRRMLGYSRREFSRLNIFDTYPEGFKGEGEARMKALRLGETLRFERAMRRKNGSLIFVEAIGWKNREGHIQAFIRDITDRKKAEDALKESRRQLRTIIDTVPHMIFAKDRKGRFLLVNRAVAEMYGREPRDLIGVRRQEIHSIPQEANAYLEVDREILATGRPKIIFDDCFTDTKGHKHILQTIKIPFKMVGMEETCILGVSVDVTEQKRVEEFRNEIVRTVSHELRTPLSIQKEGISLVLDGTSGEINPKQKMLLETVMRSVNRLSRMITSLLDISRIESGKIEIRKTKTNMDDLIRDIVFQFRKRAADKGIELRMSLPEGAGEIHVDADKITQVLSNLVDNAIKFTEGGFVEISMIRLKDEIECSVQDTGIGISSENIGKMFDKFQQFSRVVGPGEKGLGLGLSIARGIINGHGGRIWAKSVEGRGTRVTFSLPLRESGTEHRKENKPVSKKKEI